MLFGADLIYLPMSNVAKRPAQLDRREACLLTTLSRMGCELSRYGRAMSPFGPKLTLR
jgi:hypothetical protein